MPMLLTYIIGRGESERSVSFFFVVVGGGFTLSRQIRSTRAIRGLADSLVKMELNNSPQLCFHETKFLYPIGETLVSRE